MASLVKASLTPTSKIESSVNARHWKVNLDTFRWFNKCSIPSTITNTWTMDKDLFADLRLAITSKEGGEKALECHLTVFAERKYRQSISLSPRPNHTSNMQTSSSVQQKDHGSSNPTETPKRRPKDLINNGTREIQAPSVSTQYCCSTMQKWIRVG